MSILCVDYGRFVPLHWHKARPHTPKLSTPALSLTTALSKKYWYYGDPTQSEPLEAFQQKSGKSTLVSYFKQIRWKSVIFDEISWFSELRADMPSDAMT